MFLSFEPKATMPYDDLRKGRLSEPGRVYFVTAVLGERALRCFSDFVLARLVVSEMRRFEDNSLLHSYAWVSMLDHVCWLFQLQREARLARTIKAFKAR